MRLFITCMLALGIGMTALFTSQSVSAYDFIIDPDGSVVLIMPIVYVKDGDTIQSNISILPAPLNNISIRVRGIDTPEKGSSSYYTKNSGKLGRAKCAEEADLGMAATMATKSWVAKHCNGVSHCQMELRNFKWGSYSKRIVADVSINGNSLAYYLVNMGFAQVYDYKGKSAAPNWCPAEVKLT